MFHGKEPAVEGGADGIGPNLKLLRSERFPDREEWFLSTYVPL
jgi:hypothetical protein